MASPRSLRACDRRGFTRLAALGALALAGTACLPLARAGAVQTLRLPTAYPDGAFQTLIARFFAEDVNSRLRNVLSVEVYTDGSLLSWDRIAPAITSGQVEMGLIRLSWLGPTLPVAEVDAVPFLATNYAEARKLWQASRPIFLRAFATVGLVPLYAVPWPPVGLVSRTPLGSAGDLAGRRFGVTSSMTENFATAAVATPVRLNPGEALSALAGNRVDLLFMPPAQGLVGGPLPDPLYYYDIGAWLPKDGVVMSKGVYEPLNTATQETLQAAAGAAEEHGWQASQQEHNSRLSALRSRGVILQTPSTDLMEGLKAIGKTVARTWLRRAGFEGEDVLRGYRAL